MPPDFADWIHRQPCAARELDGGRCEYGIQADHAAKKRGFGMKSLWAGCIPLCGRHHEERELFRGPFKGWDRERMRRWLDERIAETQAAWVVA